MERYTRAQVLAMLALSRGRLRYWERLKLITPSIESGQAVYSLQDLIAIRTILRLTRENVPAARVGAALRRLGHDDMTVKKPLLELRLHAMGGEVVGVERGMLIELATGQRVLDLDGMLAPSDRVRDLRPLSVDDLLASAMRSDLDPVNWDQAANIYRKVIERDPDRIEAHINLGTLEFKRGNLVQAEAAYARAVDIDPHHAVARFNLANVLDERGRPADALPHLLAAHAADRENADVRFNLALLLDKLGRSAQSRPHWEAYLAKDPSSEWAALARRHLAAHGEEGARPQAQVIPLRRRR